VACAVLLLCGRALDVLAVGDDEARSLGVHPGRMRLLVVVAASLATASAVAVSGLIGFVGLVVPHITRRLIGGSNSRVLPAALLVGGAFPRPRRPGGAGRARPGGAADRGGDRLHRRPVLPGC
jgi:ABC-type Fe3+-siderophore transport system permease subunit